MIRGLLEKEFRQHGTALAFLFALVFGGLALLSGNRALAQFTGTPLEALHFFLMLLLPVAGFFLAQILVAGEFRHKTQLFLEGLPLPRWRMLAVKYALGLAMLMLCLALAFAVCWRKGLGSDRMTWRFVCIVVLKAAAWTWFAQSVLFAQAFLGRYRIIFGVVVVAGLSQLFQWGAPIGQFSAFRLIDQRFAFERLTFPVWDLAATALLCLAITGLGFWLGLMRDATVASLLAERMSPRERALLTLLTLGGMMGIAYLSDARLQGVPVRIPGAVEVERGPVHVTASAAVDYPVSKENAAVKRVAADVADELGRMAAYLGCETMPQVFIIHRRDFSGTQIENGELKPHQGLMVRANLTSSEFQEDVLQRWIMRHVLLLKSGGRAEMDRNAWVFDGFPLWWAQVHGKQPAFSAQPREARLAAGAMPSDFSPQTLRAWLRVRKTLGDEKASALAWSGLSVLAASHGEAACQRFLGAMFARDVPTDARGWLREVLAPLPRRFRTATGLGFDSFVAAWRAALEQEVHAAHSVP